MPLTFLYQSVIRYALLVFIFHRSNLQADVTKRMMECNKTLNRKYFHRPHDNLEFSGSYKGKLYFDFQKQLIRLTVHSFLFRYAV